VAAKTVKSYISTEMIPAHTKVRPDQVKETDAPASIKGLATDIVGKYLSCDLPPGVLIFDNMITETNGLPAGCNSVSVKVDQPSSDGAISGDIVDVYALPDKQNTPAILLVSNIRVLAAYTTNGQAIGGTANNGFMGGAAPMSKVASVIELAVPQGNVAAVIGAAKSPGVYLVKVK
jgi:hypothetical protein